MAADIRRVHRNKSNDQDPYITYSSSKFLDNDKKKKLNTSSSNELSSARIVKKKPDNVKSRIDYPSPNGKHYSSKYDSSSIKDKDAANKRSLNSKSYNNRKSSLNRGRSFSRSNSI
jgi:hypothetical protein